MPLYEYECNDCEHRFERIQKFSDPLVSTCPVCAGEVRKLVSSPAFQFKGTGWYVTDYARKPSGDQPSGATGDTKDGGKKDGSTKGANSKDADASSSKDASSSASKKDSKASTSKSTSDSAGAR